MRLASSARNVLEHLVGIGAVIHKGDEAEDGRDEGDEVGQGVG
jgi:hypothetical protein